MSSHVLFGLPSHRALATAALSALPSSFCVTLGFSAHSLHLPFLPCSSGWCFVLVFHRLFFGDLSLFVIWCQPLCTVASSTVKPASRRDVSSPGALVPLSRTPLHPRPSHPPHVVSSRHLVLRCHSFAHRCILDRHTCLMS